MQAQNVQLVCQTKYAVQADAYLFANPQTTLGAVHFNVTDAQVCCAVL